MSRFQKYLQFQRYRVSLIAFSILLLGFVAYYLAYVPAREDQIKERGFRILEKLAENISNKQKNLLKVGATFVQSNKLISDRSSQKNNFYYKIPDGRLQFINATEVVINEEAADTIEIGPTFSISTKGDSNRLQLFQYFDNEDSIWIAGSKDTAYRALLSLSLNTFMSSLLSFDFFENYFLINDTQIVYQYKTSGLSVVNMDTLLSVKQGATGTSIKDIQLAGSRYKLFLYPVQITQEKYSYIGGLIPAQTYDRAKFHLPDNVIVITGFLLLLLFLSFPLLKLALISKDESISSLDIISAMIMLVLITSILVLMLLNWDKYAKEIHQRNTALKELNNTIQSTFLAQISLAQQQLREFESIISHSKYENFINQRIQLNLKDSSFAVSDTTYKFKLIYPNFKFALWTDSFGEEQFYFTPDREVPALSNYYTRQYVQRVLNNQLWELPNETSSKFFVEGIYSNTTGEFRAAISTRSNIIVGNDSLVAAITTPLSSVIHPTLPLGFQFSLIDKNANVLFHSDVRKNLQENFLKEIHPGSSLSSALYADQEHSFRATYQGKLYQMYVQPVGNLPLYLVTFHDESILSAANLQTVESGFILIFINVLFITLISCVCLLSQHQKSKLKGHGIDLEWVWPTKGNVLLYGYNSLMNILLAAILCMVYLLADSAWLKLISTLSVSTVTVLFFFFSNHFKDSFKIFRKENPALLIISFFIVVGFFIGMLLHVHNLVLFFIVNACLILAAFVCWSRIKNSKNATSTSRFWKIIENRFHKITFSKLYVIMLFTWVIVVAVIPSILFFKLSSNREQQIIHKAHAIHTALSVSERLNQPLTKEKPQFPYLHTYLNTDVCFNSSSMDSLQSLLDGSKKLNKEKLFKSQSLDNGADLLRFPHNEWTHQTNLLAKHTINSAQFNWSLFPGEYWLNYNHPQADKEPLLIQTTLNNETNYIEWFRYVLFLICTALLAFFIWFVLKTFSQQVFGFGWVVSYFQVNFADQLLSNSTKSNSKGFLKTHGKVFLTALPGASGISNFLENIEKNSSPDFSILDCATLEWINAPQNAGSHSTTFYYILKNFDFGHGDKVSNDARLKTVKSILASDAPCLIISSLSAVDILAAIRQAEETFRQQNQTDSNVVGPDPSWEWTYLLSGFKQIYAPLQSNLQKETKSPGFNEHGTISKSYFLDLDQECQQGDFLAKIHSTFESTIKSSDPNSKDYIDTHIQNQDLLLQQVQNLATPYYMNLWESLNPSEQYLLYDLAKDGVLNTRNSAAINKLLAIGLLRYDERISIMNQSFRNFILTGVPPAVHRQLERQVGNTGTWNQLRTPLLVILIGVFAFIMITQKDVFNQIVVWATALVGGLGLIAKMFSFIPSGKTATEKA